MFTGPELLKERGQLLLSGNHGLLFVKGLGLVPSSELKRSLIPFTDQTAIENTFRILFSRTQANCNTFYWSDRNLNCVRAPTMGSRQTAPTFLNQAMFEMRKDCKFGRREMWGFTKSHDPVTWWRCTQLGPDGEGFHVSQKCPQMYATISSETVISRESNLISNTGFGETVARKEQIDVWKSVRLLGKAFKQKWYRLHFSWRSQRSGMWTTYVQNDSYWMLCLNSKSIELHDKKKRKAAHQRLHTGASGYEEVYQLQYRSYRSWKPRFSEQRIGTSEYSSCVYSVLA